MPAPAAGAPPTPGQGVPLRARPWASDDEQVARVRPKSCLQSRALAMGGVAPEEPTPQVSPRRQRTGFSRGPTRGAPGPQEPGAVAELANRLTAATPTSTGLGDSAHQKLVSRTDSAPGDPQPREEGRGAGSAGEHSRGDPPPRTAPSGLLPPSYTLPGPARSSVPALASGSRLAPRRGQRADLDPAFPRGTGSLQPPGHRAGG